SKNGRTLLALEIQSNRAALAAFWEEVNSLDKEPAEGKSTIDHLAAMTAGGFLTYPLPHWSFNRWQSAQPEWLVALTGKEVTQVDHFYRDLELIADLHSRAVTLNPKEEKELNIDQYWAKRYAKMRDSIFERLSEVVQRALSEADALKAH